MRVCAIVVAAGKGKRLKSKTPKPLVKLAGKPLIVYSLQALSRHPAVQEIIVVANPSGAGVIAGVIKQYRIGKIKSIVLGGRRRQDSVYNGLRAVADDSGLVLVHDAARPFIDKAMISAALKQAAAFGAAIAGVPVKATIKKAKNKNFVEKTIDRSSLWEIQTPQVFRKDLLLAAFKKSGMADVTDEAMLIEISGGKVAITPGSYNNIKVTSPEDLVLAKAIIKNGI